MRTPLSFIVPFHFRYIYAKTSFRKYINEREAENRGVHSITIHLHARIEIGVELAYARNPGMTLVSLCKEKFLN